MDPVDHLFQSFLQNLRLPLFDLTWEQQEQLINKFNSFDSPSSVSKTEWFGSLFCAVQRHLEQRNLELHDDILELASGGSLRPKPVGVKSSTTSLGSGEAEDESSTTLLKLPVVATSVSCSAAQRALSRLHDLGLFVSSEQFRSISVNRSLWPAGLLLVDVLLNQRLLK